MTPNPKHLEILSEQQKHIDILHECVKQFNLKHAIHEYNRADLKIATIPIRFDEALAAMQILQEEIDRLKAENERLKVFDGSDDHPEHRCQRCTGRNLSNWFADNDEWNKVVGDDFSILCPNCFNELSELKGIRPISWRISREGDEPLVNKLRTELVSCRELKNPKNPE